MRTRSRSATRAAKGSEGTGGSSIAENSSTNCFIFEEADNCDSSDSGLVCFTGLALRRRFCFELSAMATGSVDNPVNGGRLTGCLGDSMGFGVSGNGGLEASCIGFPLKTNAALATMSVAAIPAAIVVKRLLL